METSVPRMRQSVRTVTKLAHSLAEYPGMTTDDVCLVFTCAKNSAGFPNTCWILATIKANARGFSVVSTMWGMHNLAKAYRRALKIHCQSPSRGPLEASNGHTKDTTWLFHGPWHDAVGEHICAQPFRMWSRLRSIRFCRSHKYFKDAKAMQINRIL